MSKSWHHFSAKEHAKFLKENEFAHVYTKGSHAFYVKKNEVEQRIVQVIIGSNEKDRQSRKTMEMSIRHSGIPKATYVSWINQK
ncbi:MAG: hypothetical protein AAB664_00630 [Patescibacteria group bacterium]